MCLAGLTGPHSLILSCYAGRWQWYRRSFNVENITPENVEPVLRGQQTTIEDSPDPASPNQDFQSDVQDSQSRIQVSGEPIQNPKSKVQNGNRPYVKTPARLAAARANLEKARSAPKEKVYRRTDKRLAANRANLAKAQAARQGDLEKILDRLDLAFPPLGEEIPEEAVGPEFICSCGSGKTFHLCCKGRKPKTGIPGPNDPQSDLPFDLAPFDFAQGRRAESRRQGRRVESMCEEDEADRPKVPRTFFRIGSPKWYEEGIDREAPDYGALEKAGRALLHRQRALPNEVRREGRQVMLLLTQAAARTVAPTLQDIVALAGGLMAVLGNSRLARRAQRLNRRVAKLLEAFVEKRFEKAGVVVSAETLFQRLMAGAVAGLPPRAQRPSRPRPPAARAHRSQPAEAAQDQGPELPENKEELFRLVRRAFCAPHPEPEEEAVRHLVDDLAGCLWDRLHTFDVVLKCETERLNQALDEMSHTLPDEGRNHVRQRCWSIEAQLNETLCSAETMLLFCAQTLPPRLGTLMDLRYGPDPEIDQFCSARFELRVGNSPGLNSGR